MINKGSKVVKTRKRHQRIRKKVFGTQERPRLAVYKSNKHIYVQLIDDTSSRTLVSCSTLLPTLKKDIESSWSTEAAKKVGEEVAKAAIGKGIKRVIFDRGGNKYHGKVSALADGARGAGLEF